MSFVTTNMVLTLPTVSVDVGPTYATLLDAAMVTVDAHDHTTGKGVQITPGGMNISSDLTFNSNNATNLRTVRMYPNTSITLGVNDKGCLYELNNELYYVDGNGNNVQITSSGAINIGTVTSLTVKDSLFNLEYFGDITRKAQFSAANVPANTTRVYTLPTVSANDTLASLTATQTLTATTLTNGVVSGATATTLISGSGTLVLPTSGTMTIPNGTDTLVSLTGSQTLTNKILTGNTIASFTPNGGSNTITVPGVTDTLATLAATQTLTNKTMGSTNTLTGVTMASITNSSNTITFPTTADTLVGRATIDTLTNKTLTAPVMSSYQDLTEIATPSAPAAGVVRVYSKSDNNVYYQNASGLEQQIGSGSTSGINYISNSGFENGTVTGWSTYANTAQSTPVNGTGGSPSVTFAVTSSSPLRGTYSGLFTKGAVNYQGQGVSYAFTLASVDAGKTLQLTFDALASSALVSGDMGVYLYDVTNSVLITPSSVNLPTGTSSQYSVAMQTTTSTSYRLIFHVATTNASAYTLALDQMTLSPVVRPMVAGESDWVTYTPTFSAGFGTVTNAVGYWRRIGDSISIMGSCTTGTVAASVASISLPTVVTSINTSKLSISANTTSNPGNDVGAFSTGLANASCAIVTAPGTSTTVVYVGGLTNGTTQLVPANGSTISSSTTVCSFNFIVPVSNWSSNITLASTTPMIEYVYNTSGLTTAGSTNSSSFGYGANGAAIGSIASNVTSGNSQTVMYAQFQNAVQPTDRIQVEIQPSGSGSWFPSSLYYPPIMASGASYGIQFTNVSSTQTLVAFGNSGPAASGSTYGSQATYGWSAISTTRWRIAKYSAIGGAELAPATSISTGTITRENTWTAYTPTFSAGFGTVGSVSGYYKVLGDSLFVRGVCVNGTAAASIASISIPSGFTISSTKLPLGTSTTSNSCTIIGQYGNNNTSTVAGFILPAPGSSTSVVYLGGFFGNSSSLSNIIPQNGISVLTSSGIFTFQFEVPIV